MTGTCPECGYAPIAPSCAVCPKCGNRDWVREIKREYVTCHVCKGTGKATWQEPIRALFGKKCSFCYGSGTRTYKYRLYTIDHRTNLQRSEDIWDP